MPNGTFSLVSKKKKTVWFKLSALAPASYFLCLIFVGLCVCLRAHLSLYFYCLSACYFSKAVSLNSLCGNSVGCAVLDSALKDLQRQNWNLICATIFYFFFLSEMLFTIAGTLAWCLRLWSLLFGIDKGDQILGKHIFYSVSSWAQWVI